MDMNRIVLRLYITGNSVRSQQAIANIYRIAKKI